jgi:hypothetical protein
MTVSVDAQTFAEQYAVEREWKPASSLRFRWVETKPARAGFEAERDWESAGRELREIQAIGKTKERVYGKVLDAVRLVHHRRTF